MTTYLDRFTVRPNHLDAYLTIWPAQVALRRSFGYRIHRAFVETDAEPKFTWLYSHDDPQAETELRHSPAFIELQELAANEIFGNQVIRPVTVEIMNEPDDLSLTAIMRRYSIVGDWSEFLAIWRRIVAVRAHYGFPCLFAVADQPNDLFTWAFGFDGDWKDFPAAQMGYYHDPDRVALRGVFDYMADYNIHPARQLEVPAVALSDVA